MITKNELLEAITEIEEKPSSFQNCEKLAVLYTVYNQLYEDKFSQVIEYGYSEKNEATGKFEGDSEFIQIVNLKGINKCIGAISELVEVIQITNPKLYAGLMRKLYDV